MEVLEAWKKAPTAQLGEINRLGGNVVQRKGFSGLSQRWDALTMRQVGFETWATDMRNTVDWAETAKMHGYVIANAKGEVVEFNQKDFLQQWWSEVTDNQRDPEADHMAMDIPKSMSKSRRVIIKGANEAEILMKYSGEPLLAKLYTDQLRHRSEMIAIAEKLGSKPLPNLLQVSQRLGLVDLDADGQLKASKGDMAQQANWWKLWQTARVATGLADNPVNPDMAAKAQWFRKLSNLVTMPMSGMATLTDIPMITAQLKHEGMSINELDGSFWQSWLGALDRRFRGNREEMSKYLEAYGAGFDAVLDGTARRLMIDYGGQKQGMVEGANKVLFELNGLNRATSAHQETLLDLYTQFLAEEFGSGRPNDILVNRLREFGFSDADLVALQNPEYHIKGPDGKTRMIHGGGIEGPLGAKLRNLYLHRMRSAVMEPDFGTHAMLRFGYQSGTAKGEAVRIATQYSTFPVGMTQVIHKRFLYGYSGDGEALRAMSHLMAYLGSSLALGYMATVMKDLSRHREPIHLLNMSPFEWQRVVRQSGILGTLELVGDAGKAITTLDPTEVISPLPDTLIDTITPTPGKGFGGNVQEALQDSKLLQGAAYPLISPTSQWIIGEAFGTSLASAEGAEAEYTLRR